MNKTIKNVQWDRFEDAIDWEKFITEGYAELRRKYVKDTQYRVDPQTGQVLSLISAKGISAFLAFGNDMFPTKYGISLYCLLRDKMQIDLEGKIFPAYFGECLKHMVSKEGIREKFKHRRKSTSELIVEHLEAEKIYFSDSNILYHEVNVSKESLIKEIQEAALYYQTWINGTYLKDNTDNSDPGDNSLDKFDGKHKSARERKKPGRKPSQRKPIEQYFIKLSGAELNEFLQDLKAISIDFTPKEFVFMIVALDELGHLGLYSNIGIFSAFETFLGRTYGGTSSKNADMQNAKHACKNGYSDPLLSKLMTTISKIIEKNKAK